MIWVFFRQLAVNTYDWLPTHDQPVKSKGPAPRLFASITSIPYGGVVVQRVTILGGELQVVFRDDIYACM